MAYALGVSGDQTLEFAGDGIVVSVRHSGEFTEFVPLLQAGAEGTAGFTLSCDPPATAAGALVYRLRFTR